MKVKHIILIVLVAVIALGTIALFVLPHKILAPYLPKMVHIDKVDMIVYPDKASMKFKIVMLNDAPVEALLDSISYKVLFDTIEFSRGAQVFNKNLDKDGNDTITLPLEMKFDKLDKAFASFENKDSIDLKINFLAHMHFPVIGAVTVPLDVDVRMPSLVRPEIKLENIDLTKLRFREVSISADLAFINKNNLKVKIKDMKLFLQIPGLLEGNIIHMDTIDIKAKDTSRFTMPVEITDIKFLKTAWKFLFNKKEIEFIMTGKMKLLLPMEGAEEIDLVISTKGLAPFAGGGEDEPTAKETKDKKKDN